jgi:1,5-anhydro-D-fructose reductase (1,5-anhydro-D-mannitol-forming)
MVIPERFFDPRQSAGGVTIDFGAHPLYLLANLLGMPDEVNAAYDCFTARVVEDHSVVAMSYPNGAIGVAEASFLGASAPFLIEAHGTDGSLFYDPRGGLRASVLRSGVGRRRVGAGAGTRGDLRTRATSASIFRKIRNG